MSAEVHITFLTETAGFFSFTHDGTVTMNAYVNMTTPNASKTFGSANAGVRDGCRPSIANWPTNSVVKRPRQTKDMNWNHMFSSRLRKPNGTQIAIARPEEHMAG